MAGTDENGTPGSEVLEQGTQDPGRLEALGRSRGVRIAASGLLATAVLGWLALGPGVPGLTSAPAPTGEVTGADDAASVPAVPVAPTHERDHECERDEDAGTGRDGVGGSADARSRALAARLYRFARHPSAGAKVPWAEELSLRSRGAAPVVVARDRVGSRATWTGEPGAGGYLLADLAASRGRYHVGDTVHLDCRNQPREARTRPDEKSWISVQALSSTGCSDWWAVDVFLDRRDRVARVTVIAR